MTLAPGVVESYQGMDLRKPPIDNIKSATDTY